MIRKIKKQIKITLVFCSLLVLLNSSECNNDLCGGFEKEPNISISFENEIKFKTYSESINIPKKRANSSENPGIDMNATETKYWIEYNSKFDSFTFGYRLKSKYENNRCLIIYFDTAYIIQSSFKNCKLEYYLSPRITIIE